MLWSVYGFMVADGMGRVWFGRRSTTSCVVVFCVLFISLASHSTRTHNPTHGSHTDTELYCMEVNCVRALGVCRVGRRVSYVAHVCVCSRAVPLYTLRLKKAMRTWSVVCWRARRVWTWPPMMVRHLAKRGDTQGVSTSVQLETDNMSRQQTDRHVWAVARGRRVRGRNKAVQGSQSESVRE